MTRLTQAQLDALYKVYMRWQNKTPHVIMPLEFKVLSEEEYLKTCGAYNYIGVWVGGPTPEHYKNPGSAMFLGIEVDGYTHS